MELPEDTRRSTNPSDILATITHDLKAGREPDFKGHSLEYLMANSRYIKSLLDVHDLVDTESPELRTMETRLFDSIYEFNEIWLDEFLSDEKKFSAMREHENLMQKLYETYRTFNPPVPTQEALLSGAKKWFQEYTALDITLSP